MPQEDLQGTCEIEILTEDDLLDMAGTLDSLVEEVTHIGPVGTGFEVCFRWAREVRQPDPTPQEIEERCREIREGWTPDEHLERAGCLSRWTVPKARLKKSVKNPAA